MKDIKIKKISTNKTEERTVERVVDRKENSKSNLSYLSAFLFGLMSTSILCYIFLISSSIFYAVQASQFQYQSESISAVIQDFSSVHTTLSRNSTDRISYIDYDTETSISIK